MEKDFLWIIDCMQSCRNQWQLECCRNLNSLFILKYSGKDGWLQYSNHLLEVLEKIADMLENPPPNILAIEDIGYVIPMPKIVEGL